MVLNCYIPTDDKHIAVLVSMLKGTDILKKRYIFIEVDGKFKKYKVDKYIYNDGSHFLTCSPWS